MKAADVTQAQNFIEQYHALKRRECSVQEWMQLKLSCGPALAARLLDAVAATGYCPYCAVQPGPDGCLHSRSK
jgi:hypothetical protein